jgi:Protein of unknown function (DUF3192)
VRRWIAGIALLAAASACSTLIVDPLEQLRSANKLNLARVAPGMTRFEVETVMGASRAGGGLPEVVFGRVQYLQAKNPMREERVTGSDGAEYLVLFYYTDVKKLDDKITDDELTPVVLRDGKVAGLGYAFLGARVPRYRQYASP